MHKSPAQSTANPRQVYDLVSRVLSGGSLSAGDPAEVQDSPEQVINVYKTRQERDEAILQAASQPHGSTAQHWSLEPDDEYRAAWYRTAGGLIPDRSLNANDPLRRPGLSIHHNPLNSEKSTGAIVPTTIDNFPGSETGSPLCETCKPHHFGLYWRWNPADSQSASLGTLKELLSRQSCPFCRLLTRALYLDDCAKHLPARDVLMKLKVTVRMRYRYLEVKYGSSIQRGIRLPHSHLPTISEVDGHPTVAPFLERFAGLGFIQWPTFNASYAKEWLHTCETTHGSVCNTLHYPHREPFEAMELMFIDVREKCLVKGTSSSRYMGLSYMWGHGVLFKTTKSNVKGLQKRGALEDPTIKLPRVILDAMELVSAIGENLLWVDALCIVQDDKEQKQSQINQMNVIYQNAILTIIAMSGNDCNAGLRGFSPDVGINQRAVEVVDGLPLVWTAPDLRWALAESCYDTRGWTFQERLLSRRCLFMSDSQVYFTCLQSVQREDDFHDDMDYENNNSDMSNINPLVSSRILLHGELNQNSWHELFWVYSRTVISYSQRELTYDSDVLNAFSGMTQAISGGYNTSFFYGLPIALLDLALLWVPDSDVESRGICGPGAVFPTWSWCGWIGHISYPFTPSSDYNQYRSGKFMLRSEINSFSTYKNGKLQALDRDHSLLTSIPNGLRDPPPSAPYDGFKEHGLYFWAYTLPSRCFRVRSEPKKTIERPTYRAVYNAWTGDQCGIFFTGRGVNLSYSMSYTTSRSEHDSWDVVLLSRSCDPIGLREFLTENSQWDTVNVLLINWSGSHATRVAVGVIGKNVWDGYEPVRKYICLV